MNLRWRLTLFYGLVSSAILVIGGTALYFSLRSSLYGLLDEGLRGAANQVAERFAPPGRRGDDGSRPLGGRRGGPDNLRPRLSGDTTLTLFNANGVLSVALEEPPVDAPLIDGIASIGGYRVLTLRLSNGAWVQAARLESDALSALQRTQQLLTLGLPLLLLAGLGAGYWLADRALKPVDAVTKLAMNIAASGRSGQRVPQAIGDDEMARLTRTVNAMLERLEAMIDSERAFALAAAHELRTPLAILQGRVSLSLERERTPQHYREALLTVSQSTDKLTAMVESLLTLARSHVPAQLERLDLADIALEVFESHQDLLSDKHQRINLELDSAITLGDASGLRLALSNLIRNASRYGHDHGQIWLRSSRHAGSARLEVSDDGPGIGSADLERLRKPFQRGAGLQGVAGSGLGLALVDAVARQHGGSLELSRAREGGLRAVIALPVAG